METAFHSAATLFVFLLTIFATYATAHRGLPLRIPRTRFQARLSFAWVPWIATGVLLLLQAISFQDVGVALAGDGSGPCPWKIVVQMLAVSYISLTAELSGFYAWLALQAARQAQGRPRLLLASLFGLSGLISAATSPDVSLVTLTPVFVYAATAANLDPMTLAAAHMGAACSLGLLLPVANPVNLIVASAFRLTFLRFAVWMFLPTLAATLVLAALLYLLTHRRRLSWSGAGAGSRQGLLGGSSIMPLCPDPGLLLHDQVGAAFGAATLCGCLLAMAVGPSLRWAEWAVAAVFGAVAALYNCAAMVGPLTGAIGRRGAYERKRRLHAELAKQGLHRALSDEDLADLLLSAAQHRQASITRLAAAAATRVAVTAAAQQAMQQQQQEGGSRHSPTGRTGGAFGGCSGGSSGGLWGFSRRPSSSGVGSGSISLGSLASPSAVASAGASAGNTGASGARTGAGIGSSGSIVGSVGLGALGANSGSPSRSGGVAGMGSCDGGGAGASSASMRHWFSRRWGSLGRGRSVSAAMGAELAAAAADAGADLDILADCGAAAAAAAVAARQASSAGIAMASSAGQGTLRGAATTTAAAAATGASCSWVAHTRGGGGSAGGPHWSAGASRLSAIGTAAAATDTEAADAAAATTTPLAAQHMSMELQQLLTHGTAAAPDTAEWWAAAAHAAEQELLRRGVRGGGGGGGSRMATVALGPEVSPRCCDQQQQEQQVGASHCLEDIDGGLDGALVAVVAPCTDARVAAAPERVSKEDGDCRGSCGAGSAPRGTPPTVVSAFAAAGAMLVSGWDGRLESATAAPWVASRAAAATAAASTSAAAAGAGTHELSALAPGTAAAGPDLAGPSEPVVGPQAAAAAGSAPHREPSPDVAELPGAARRQLHPQPPQHGHLEGAAGAAAASRVLQEEEQEEQEAGSRLPAGALGCTEEVVAAAKGGGACRGRGSNYGDNSTGDWTSVEGSREGATARDGGKGTTVVAGRSSSTGTCTGAGARLPHGGDPPLQGRTAADSPDQQAVSVSPPRPLRHHHPPLLPCHLDECRSPAGGICDNGPERSPSNHVHRHRGGFEGLFGFWRPDTVGAAAESAALLPGGFVAASDHPRHAALPPPPPLPSGARASVSPAASPASAAAAALGKALSGADAVAWGSRLLSPGRNTSRDGRYARWRDGGNCGGGGGGGGNLAVAPRGGAAGTMSPFAMAAMVGPEGMGGGGGGPLGRCDSVGAGSMNSCAATPQCGGSGSGRGAPQYPDHLLVHHPRTVPSLALMLFGPSEVSFWGTFTGLPWAHVVLLLGMFVLLEALQVQGWLAALASSLDAMAASADPRLGHERSTGHSHNITIPGHNTTTGPSSSSSTSSTSISTSSPPPYSSYPSAADASAAVASAVFSAGWLAAGLAIAMTGQWAALLLARAMLRPEFLGTSLAGGPARRGAALALVAACGLAPALSLSGSLTGLRWGLGLRDLGVRLRCCKHMVGGLAPAAVAALMAALAVLWVQAAAWS